MRAISVAVASAGAGRRPHAIRASAKTTTTAPNTPASCTAGLSTSAYTTIDGRSAANLRFNGVEVGNEAVLHTDAEEMLQRILANISFVRMSVDPGSIRSPTGFSARSAAFCGALRICP